MQATTPHDRRSHWEGVYLQKNESELSWHQDEPVLSLRLVTKFCPPGGTVLDVGGGTSLLAERLAEIGLGVTVLDLSGAALRRAQERSGDVASKIRWVVGDVCAPFSTTTGPFDVWHDRAVFHFLSSEHERSAYMHNARQILRPGGNLIISTFAPDGPEQCSDLPVQRYDAPALTALFSPTFTAIESYREVHSTPWGSQQAFTYVVLQKASEADR